MASSPTTTAAAAIGEDGIYNNLLTSATPLAKLLPHIKAGFLFAFGMASFFVRWATRLLRHLYLPIPIILYLLEPVTVFLRYLAEIFVLTPYNTVVYLADALHPVYVFCGVACLTGILVGVVGRTLTGMLVATLLPPVLVEAEPVKDRKGKGKELKPKMEDSDEDTLSTRSNHEDSDGY
ncbi:hypothetical protein FA15DRAFT_710436 [Coprinopsis marcescibilis]|uniref:Uncharacterized protein n=1 Tax=Coprinopsis marcescibilis TaxID=230819 RepID=A0A5C3KCK1_COPMA|nr:hypothetical protein FA15DRAFT_710436 [Coprinopsis marcescibilis]